MPVDQFVRAHESITRDIDRASAPRQQEMESGQYVCIRVTDTGSGMDEDTIARAFEPFFTTKPLGQGTGLGLSMIYGFARQSEGYTTIESERGRGTTFSLFLPRYDGAMQTEPTPEQAPAERTDAAETVLVVEDEPEVRGLIVEVLSELGYHAIEAGDGPEGLEKLRSRHRIDLLVTDIGLPGLNGRQIADAGRELRPGLKVLFMTGYAENAALAPGFLQPGTGKVGGLGGADVPMPREAVAIDPDHAFAPSAKIEKSIGCLGELERERIDK